MMPLTPMAKSAPQPDVLVLGEHPAAYLAAALLRADSKLHILHSTIPGEKTIPRRTLVNPALFGLHPLLKPLRRKLDLTGIYGIRFLGNDPQTCSESRHKTAMIHSGRYGDIRSAMIALARKQGVDFISPRSLQIQGLDETGIDLLAGRTALRPRMLVVGGMLPPDQRKMLGMPDGWGPDLVHRYSFLKLKEIKGENLGARPIMPMSLDLDGTLHWAWLLPGGDECQLCVEQPAQAPRQTPPAEMMRRWIAVLQSHRILQPDVSISTAAAVSIDLPLAGALAHEGVANRTLLIGPAGGFYSAVGEDIYPNCWSALFAADTAKKALKEVHLQDALQPYRHKWRTTLGNYLRGPQQNLRFLLPLVYRNQVMADRLADAILVGKGVVR